LAHEHAANVVAYGACILVFSINFALLWLCCWFFSCLIGFLGYVNVSTLELCSLLIWIFVILGLRFFQVLSMVVILFFAFFFFLIFVSDHAIWICDRQHIFV
jgi:hypothetical protein